MKLIRKLIRMSNRFPRDPLWHGDKKALTTEITEEVKSLEPNAKSQKRKAESRQLLPQNPSRQLSARNRDLFARAQMLECEGIGRHFVLADDEDVSRPHLVGGLE